jgi:predicted nucleic acid-binding Zn finger protein
MSNMTTQKSSTDEYIARFSRISSNSAHLKKAAEAVLDGCVKKHIFTPSGRILFTVVGRSGDEFIDPEKPFCSCRHFFFRVLGGRDLTCYHLLAYEMAKESQKFDQVEMHDEEFGTFLKLLASDLLDNSRDKEDKDNQEPSDSRPR